MYIELSYLFLYFGHPFLSEVIIFSSFNVCNVYNLMLLLFLELPAAFKKPLNDVRVTEKQEAILECQVSKPNVSIIWKKDGKEIKPSDKIKFVSDGSTRQIIFTEAALMDEADYSCCIGDVETTATLFVDGNFI